MWSCEAFLVEELYSSTIYAKKCRTYANLGLPDSDPSPAVAPLHEFGGLQAFGPCPWHRHHMDVLSDRLGHVTDPAWRSDPFEGCTGGAQRSSARVETRSGAFARIEIHSHIPDTTILGLPSPIHCMGLGGQCRHIWQSHGVSGI